MSSLSGWLKPDHNNRSKGTGALLPAYLLATMRYGPRWSAAATRGRFTAYGPLTVGHILPALCLELSVLEPIRSPSMIRSMHWMSQCRGSLRRPTEGTWSCISATRDISSSGRSRYNPWSREWWLYTISMCKCRAAVFHLLHHLRPRPCLHLHRRSLLHTTIHPKLETTTTTTSRILTMISIRRF